MTRSEALKVAKPILFNTAMTRAIQNGTKTVTRRLIKSNKADLSKCRFVKMSTDPSETRIARNGEEYPHELKGLYATFEDADGGYFPLVKALYQVGDILYVRETFFEFKGHYYYKADGKHTALDKLVGGSFFKWHPSIHMPKEAARMFLRVTGVRVERLQDINNAGAIAEGCDGRCECPQDGALSDWQKRYDFSVEKFISVWDSALKKSDLDKYGWDANPWVWVIEFEKMEVEL